jgi:Double sensory domain of two-component sensor kinase
LRLRSKFMWSFALLTAGLTCVTLMIVRRTAESRVRLEIKQEALNSILTFQVLAHQHQVALSHKADLLASLAMMRNGEATALQDAADDPWHSEDCDLLALAGPNGKIIAVHTSMARFSFPAAQEMFDASPRNRRSTGWWYSGSRLYQVVLQPFYEGPENKGNLVGTVIVGHSLDPSAKELRRISSSQMAFQCGSDVVASTLAPSKTEDFARQLKAGPIGEQIKIDGERFYAKSVDLTPQGAKNGSDRPARRWRCS